VAGTLERDVALWKRPGHARPYCRYCRRVLTLVGEALPDQLRETAYALAAEVAASDLTVKDVEMGLLEMLADELGLDDLVCAALERGARARHRTV